MRKTLLSIDLDFFTPEDPMWMWDHTEHFGGHIASIIWHSRLAWSMSAGFDLKEMTGTHRADFRPSDLIETLSRLGWSFDDVERIVVSDSHMWAADTFLPFLGEDVRIVNVDAHADMGYSDARDMRKRLRGGKLQCEDWLWFMRALASDLEVVQVYPGWKGLRELEGDPHWAGKERIRAEVWSERLMRDASGPVSAIHIARSSAWVPPWHDAEMVDAIYKIGRDVGVEVETCEDCALEVRDFDAKVTRDLAATMSVTSSHACQDSEDQG